MTERTDLFVCVLAILVVGHLAAVPLGVATVGDDASSTDSIAEIDDRLLGSDGERAVLVHFGTDGVDVESDAVEAELRTHARRTQAPLDEFAAATEGVAVERRFWIANVALVTVDTDAVALTEIAAIDGVEYVGPNPTVAGESTVASADAETATVDRTRVDDPPSRADTDATVSWALDQINAPEVWDEYDTRGEGMRVAILDTGVDADHPDIDVAMWGDWDERGNELDTDPQDYDTDREPSGHGTHVSALVTGGDASGTQIGTAPDAELMAGAVMTDCDADGCAATAAQILAGLQWAVQNDADVATLSIGLGGHHSDFIEGIRWAQRSGTVVVASAGNDGAGTASSPGSEYDPISVGASNITGEILALSAGKEIDTDAVWGSNAPDDWPDRYIVPTVTAPGWNVASAVVGGQWSRGSGTSQAAPHVAGGIALIQAATEEDLSPVEMRAVLTETAGKPDGAPEGQDDRWGHGIVNLYTATQTAVAGDYDAEDPPPDPDTSIDVDDPVADATTFDWYLADADQTVTVTVEPGSGDTFEAGGEAVVTVAAQDDAVADAITLTYGGTEYTPADGSVAIPLDADGVQELTLEHADQTGSFDLQVEPREETTTTSPDSETTTTTPDSETTAPASDETTQPPDPTTDPSDADTTDPTETDSGDGTGAPDDGGTATSPGDGGDADDGGAPGFGVLLGVAGVLAALVARRRRS